ncbi:phosphoglucomutase/phosphomannomutase family protein [bacterium]|nr:phosphoglucomutase/phosphomannomutase family protein [bacterium]
MPPIKFGTDGWRAVIDDDFIPANIEKVIQAFCDWRIAKFPNQKKVIVGFDRRNKSRESAELVASVLAGNGFTVNLSSHYCPTPCVSWMTKVSDAFCGIMITASHNPWNWNGIKFKEDFGGSASPEYTNFIEAQLAVNEKAGRQIEKTPFAVAMSSKQITFFDPKKEYVNQIKSLLDLKAIAASPYKILYDAMHGAGAGYVGCVIGEQSQEMNGDEVLGTVGVNPEPIDKNLSELLSRMKKEKFALALATDGDADRIGAVDENGNFVNSHQIFALLLQHYVEDKKLKGDVVKSLSTSQMINRLCEKYGINCIETPVGFKHICKILAQKNALIGGEESGGISFRDHVHERDGVLNGLMLLNMMAVRKKKLTELVNDLQKVAGTYYYDRYDWHGKAEQMDGVRSRLASFKPQSICGLKVKDVNLADGYKFILEDGSWLLLRSSGTEPLIRIYAETNKKENVQALLGVGRQVVNGE